MFLEINKKNVELAEQRDERGPMSGYPGKRGEENPQDPEEGFKIPSEEVEDVFFAIFIVEKEIVSVLVQQEDDLARGT